MGGVQLARQSLYELVWKESRLELAKRWGVTPAMITHACESAGIPLPGVGYFAKLEARRTVKRPRLPQRDFGAAETIVIGHPDRRPWKPPETEDDIPIPDVPTFPEPMETVLARARAAVAGKPTFKDLRKTHPLLQRRIDHEIKHSSTTRNFGQRERIILNNLLWILVPLARFIIRVDFKPIYVRVADTSMELKIESTRDVVTVSVPGVTDEWSLPTKWTDAPGAPVEDRLHEIAAVILAGAELYYRLNAEYQRTWAIERRAEIVAERVKQEEARIAREVAAREEVARARRARLLEHADNLGKSERILALVAAVTHQFDGRTLPAELEAWLQMARAEADALDPRKMPVTRLVE